MNYFQRYSMNYWFNQWIERNLKLAEERERMAQIPKNWKYSIPIKDRMIKYTAWKCSHGFMSNVSCLYCGRSVSFTDTRPDTFYANDPPVWFSYQGRLERHNRTVSTIDPNPTGIPITSKVEVMHLPNPFKTIYQGPINYPDEPAFEVTAGGTGPGFSVSRDGELTIHQERYLSQPLPQESSMKTTNPRRYNTQEHARNLELAYERYDETKRILECAQSAVKTAEHAKAEAEAELAKLVFPPNFEKAKEYGCWLDSERYLSILMTSYGAYQIRIRPYRHDT